MRDPAIAAPSEDTNWVEQEVAKYFGREKKVLQDELNGDCSRTELSKLRQGCMKLRERLFELCCKVQLDPYSVDFIELLSLSARLKATEQAAEVMGDGLQAVER